MLVAGALIASTVGLTLWRRTAHALDSGRETSSGSRTGIWLGLGLAVRSFFADTGAEAGLEPVPALTVLLVPIGYLLTCWTTRCAGLLLAAAPPHRVRTFTTIGLVGTAGLFAFWLDWCESSDLLFQPDLLAVLQQHTAQLYGFADPSEPAVRAVMLTVIITSSFGPLLPWAAATLWLVPLLAWTPTLPGQHVDRHHLPPLRGLIGIGAAAGAASLILAVLVEAFFHASVGLPPGPAGVTFQGNVLAVLLAFPLAAATIFPAVARGRENGLAGAVVAGVALVVCSLGLLTISVVTGCVEAQLPFGTSCARFGPIIGVNIRGLVLLLLGPATIAATLLALVVSSVAVPIRQRLDGPPAARDPSASAASDLSARRRATVAAIAVIVVGLDLMTVSEYTSTENGPPTETGPVLAAPPAATSPQVRRAQLSAWIVYGGDALLLSLPDSLQEFAAGLRRIGRGDRWYRDDIELNARAAGEDEGVGPRGSTPSTSQVARSRAGMADACRPGLPRSTLFCMTAWIALFAVTVLFTLALRRSSSTEPPLPPGYDGERQLAELYALTSARMTAPLP